MLLLIKQIELIPPDIIPKVKEVPTKNPIGRGTVLFNKKFKLCFLFRFCDPRHKNEISNIAAPKFRVISCNLKNI